MDRTIIENGFYILRYKNEDDEILKYEEAVGQEFTPTDIKRRYFVV